MAWKPVIIDRDRMYRGKAYASVGHNKVSFNSAACDLISDFDSFNYAVFLEDDTRPSEHGILLTREKVDNSVPVKRKVQKGKAIKCFEIASKDLTQKVFGRIATQTDNVTHFNIKVENAGYGNCIIVLTPGTMML